MEKNASISLAKLNPETIVYEGYYWILCVEKKNRYILTTAKSIDNSSFIQAASSEKSTFSE